ncbi:MAG: hypothetical protein IPM39_29340 [Chloroflexi bacterium]|nr:hypothetical protein [Chloroflexota bacterium]
MKSANRRKFLAIGCLGFILLCGLTLLAAIADNALRDAGILPTYTATYTPTITPTSTHTRPPTLHPPAVTHPPAAHRHRHPYPHSINRHPYPHSTNRHPDACAHQPD